MKPTSEDFLIESENSRAAVEQMRVDSDVVQAWLVANCVCGDGYRLERQAAYADFVDFCEMEDRQALTKNGFFKALRQKNFHEVKGRSARFFEKVSIKSADKPKNEWKTVKEENPIELPFT